MTSISAQFNSPYWITQVTKSITLAATSVGLGWLTGRFWRGPEQGLACSGGLVVGALSGNIVALAAGSSLCLPSVAAESTVHRNPVLKHPILNGELSPYIKSAVEGLELKSPIISQFIKENLPNPKDWVAAIDALFDDLWHSPDFKLSQEQQQALNSIRETGDKFQKFVNSLQTSPTVYQNLVKNYRSRLENVQTTIRELFEFQDLANYVEREL